MQIEDRSLEQVPTAPSDSWFAPLAMFIAWLARMFDSIARMKRIRRTTKFKPNWRDHFANLRMMEWHRDQIMAAAAAELLAGKEPDLNAISFYYDPPDDFGGPCPRTPFDMNRRFLAAARWHTDPMFFIHRHANRIAKRALARLDNPFAAHGSTDAAPCAAARHEAGARRETGTLLALMVSSAPCARPSNHEGQQRAPPGAMGCARGPPHPSKPETRTSLTPSARTHPHAQNPPATHQITETPKSRR